MRVIPLIREGRHIYVLHEENFMEKYNKYGIEPLFPESKHFYKIRDGEMTKYGAKKTEVNGILFDSKLEAERYKQLLLLERAGEIVHLRLQPEFQIEKGCVGAHTGEKFRSTFYVGDFQYCDVRTHKMIVEDTKGMETPEFRRKWKEVRLQYPEYEFRKLTKDDV